MSTGWISCKVVFVAISIWLTYEIINATLMPDDFELKDEDIWPLDERPNTKEEANEKN